MKTALVTHVWLDNPLPGYKGTNLGRCRRLDRFIRYYNLMWPTVVLDNGSSRSSLALYWQPKLKIINQQPHYDRPSMLDYPAVWRNYWTIKGLLNEYDRIFYIATDARILSQRLLDYIEGLESGWTALFSPKYNFPEPCIQVITKCPAFERFFFGECDRMRYNGNIEELTLPLTHVEKGFIGDRFSEYGPEEVIPPMDTWDFVTQVSDSPDFDDSVFPVVRRIEGKATICKP